MTRTTYGPKRESRPSSTPGPMRCSHLIGSLAQMSTLRLSLIARSKILSKLRSMESTKRCLLMDRRAQVKPTQWKGILTAQRWPVWSHSQLTSSSSQSRIQIGNSAFLCPISRYITKQSTTWLSQLTKIWTSGKAFHQVYTLISSQRRKWQLLARLWATCRKEMTAGILPRLGSMSLVVDLTLYSGSTSAPRKMERSRCPSSTLSISQVQKVPQRPKPRASDSAKVRTSTSHSLPFRTWSTSYPKAQTSSLITVTQSWQESCNRPSEEILRQPSSVPWLRPFKTIRRPWTLFCLDKRPKMSKLPSI